ncbi:MAG TPA: chitobiase/beta-hexosaminidase C-terminal domain-containing protein [Spirochaetota bacterium]|nr:chitobiase/beta-hexosaminidase C-terminal domain-containing protein [Spirochaetota bacterium]
MKKILLFALLSFTMFQCDFFVSLPEKKQNIPSKPYFDPPGGTYDLPIDITIITDSAGADIFLTIDESEPSKTNYFLAGKERVLYKGGKIVIKAIAYKDGFASEISIVEYK